MKIGVLVGAAGLALAGVAYAEESPANLRTTDDATDAKQTTVKRLAGFSDFAAKRDAVIGAPGSKKRMVAEDEMRALIGAGVIDPKRSLLLLDDDSTGAEIGESLLTSRRSSLSVSASGNAGGAPGFFDFGQSPPFIADDFESYKARDLSLGLPTSHDPPGVSFDASNGSIVSQVAPWGPIWDTDGFTPDADDPEIMVIVGADDPNLPPDAPTVDGVTKADGSGNGSGQMLGMLRTLSPTTTPADNDIDITDNDLVFPTADLPVVVGIDFYQASRMEIFNWIDLASLAEGFVSVRYFEGGFPNELGLQGVGVRPPSSSAGALGRHPIVLGTLEGNFTIGEFYDNGLALNADQWSTVALRISNKGQTMFHRTPDTDGSKGVLITDRDDSIPFTGFEMGWAETYPGKPGTCLSGDCLTAGEGGTPVPYPQDGTTPSDGTYLGTGLGLQQAGFNPPDDAGEGQAPHLAAVSHDFLSIHRFNDPDTTVVTNFTPNDVYYDNYFVSGERFVPPLPGPDQTLPFVDDLERWLGNDTPIRLQGGDSWFDALSSLALVNSDASNNSTTGAGSALPPKPNAGAPTQSLVMVNSEFSAQNTFRTEDTSFYPVAMASPGSDGDFGAGPDGIVGTGDDTAAAADNEPSVSSVMVKLNNTTNVRALNTSGQTTLVLLGTENPGTGATDNRVYVRGPNENFAGTRYDFQEPADLFDSAIPETLSQNHWRSSAQKALQPDFNDNFWNFEAMPDGQGSGSFTIPTGRFFEVRVEIPGDNPQGLADGDGNQFFPYKLFVDGVELCPPSLNGGDGTGDCTNNTWLAQALSQSSLSFQSGSSTFGLNQEMVVDDIRALGRVRDRGQGPDFSLPYVEDFEGYAVDPDSLSNQGPFDFLRSASIQPTQNNPIPFYDQASFVPRPGNIQDPPVSTNFCRYELVEYTSAAEIPDGAGGTIAPGSIIAINANFFDSLNPANTGCPGSTVAGSEFVFLAAPTPDFNVGGTQLSTGIMRLDKDPGEAPDPEPSQAGDFDFFRFDQHPANRWLAGGADTVRLDAPAAPDADMDTVPDFDLGDKTFRVVATGGGADEDNFTMTDRNSTFVPGAPNPDRPAFVPDFGRVTFDMFIDRQPDIPGDPISDLFDAPLQRYSIQIQGIPANGNREDPKLIAEMRFGGPDLSPTAIPSDRIALFSKNPDFPTPPGEPAVPEFLFVDTTVPVPLAQWFRVGFEIDRKSGDFKWLLDTTPTAGEDIFVSADGVTDVTAVAGASVLTSSLTEGVGTIGSLQFRIGNDENGNGARTPPKVMVQGARIDLDKDNGEAGTDLTLLPLPTDPGEDGMLGTEDDVPLSDPWNAPRPAEATAGPADWCVYEIDSAPAIPGGGTPTAPLVQPVDPTTGADDGAPRALANQDLLAVWRRNPDRSFAAGVVFDDFRAITRQVADADIVDAPGPDFGGPLLPDCPSKTVNGSTDDGYIFLNDNGDEVVRGTWTLEGQPGQAGINDPFPNGGIRNDSPPYNGGIGEPLPDGSPGALTEGHRNILLAQFYMIPELGADIEPQRWFIDNITVTEDCFNVDIGPNELLELLANFNLFGPAGLLDLLANFGGLHSSCPQ